VGVKDCNELLIKEMDYLKSIGVPMGYLSFQGGGASAGASHDDTAAPWCVSTWGVDGGQQKNIYPQDLKTFQQNLDIPLQLYAPYFCNNTNYFNASTPFNAVESNISIDGCGHYHFLDVEPDQSRLFYDSFFAKGEAVGMVSFEPDFMNQNYNCVNEFIHSATNASLWQHGMADAALAKNLTVQWCYATPTDVLASLTMPAVTNFRVSNDFCYGQVRAHVMRI
jgi:hypothetical protein